MGPVAANKRRWRLSEAHAIHASTCDGVNLQLLAQLVPRQFSARVTDSNMLME